MARRAWNGKITPPLDSLRIQRRWRNEDGGRINRVLATRRDGPLRNRSIGLVGFGRANFNFSVRKGGKLIPAPFTDNTAKHSPYFPTITQINPNQALGSSVKMAYRY